MKKILCIISILALCALLIPNAFADQIAPALKGIHQLALKEGKLGVPLKGGEWKDTNKKAWISLYIIEIFDRTHNRTFFVIADSKSDFVNCGYYNDDEGTYFSLSYRPHMQKHIYEFRHKPHNVFVCSNKLGVKEIEEKAKNFRKEFLEVIARNQRPPSSLSALERVKRLALQNIRRYPPGYPGRERLGDFSTWYTQVDSQTYAYSMYNPKTGVMFFGYSWLSRIYWEIICCEQDNEFTEVINNGSPKPISKKKAEEGAKDFLKTISGS